MFDRLEVSRQAQCVLIVALKHHVPDFEVAYQDGGISRLDKVVSMFGARSLDNRHPRN
jgi:hypothetical protein